MHRGRERERERIKASDMQYILLETRVDLKCLSNSFLVRKNAYHAISYNSIH